MSNRAYLCSSNLDTIYPSFVQKDYDAPEQTIATDVENLPLLWLALFREGDLRRETFKVDGQSVPAFAPVCPKEKALGQLAQALPYLNGIFAGLGPMNDYVAMFRTALEAVPSRVVSIELEEIAGLYPPEHRFEELLTLALRGFDAPAKIQFHCDEVTIEMSNTFTVEAEGLTDEELEELGLKDGPQTMTGPAGGQKFTIPAFTANSHADVLERVTSLRTQVRLPSVRIYLDNLKYSDDEQWNFTRVLGAGRHGSMGFGRETPWEKEDADYGWKFIPAEDED